jgi:hypothetical protein
LSPQAIQDSYHVHGYLYVRLRWHNCAAPLPFPSRPSRIGKKSRRVLASPSPPRYNRAPLDNSLPTTA